MLPRTAIVRIAKLIGEQLQSGEGAGEDALAAIAALAASGAGPEVLSCLIAEMRRKRPKDRLVGAYAFMLCAALDVMRLEANGGNAEAGRAIQDVRDGLAQHIHEGAEPTALLLVARAFAQAGLEPGKVLQDAMVAGMEARPAGAATDLSDVSRHFAEIAAGFDDDPFAIHAELAQSAAAFPAEHRAKMAAALAVGDHPVIREAAVGFALSPDAAVGAAALAALAQQQRPSSATVERLVRVRPWLAEARRAGVDAAIRALRPKAAAPVAAVRPEIRVILASLQDGGGAQSLFALVKRGRRFALASVLLKTGEGVADAWVRDDMTKAEADALIEAIVQSTEVVEVSIALFERRVAAALATNAARDAPPAFALVQVAETLGLGPVHPEAVTASALVEPLLAGLPAARTGAAATRAAHRDSAGWQHEFEMVASWFEAGAAIDALLRPIKTRKRRVEAVLAEILPGRRGFWADCCAWMAATLKDGAEADDERWIGFALVARDLAGDGPLAPMPIAAQLAAATVEAFEQR